MSEDGRHEFDFIFGRWQVHNRRLVDRSDPSCEEWVEFEATSEAFPLLDGYGHLDRIHAPDFEGFTLRLFDPASGAWKIWWSSTTAPGVLDPPVEGRFREGHGTFEGEGETAGRAVRVRLEWFAERDAPRWQQSFSFDDGQTWKLNWTMTFSRVS